MIKKLKIKNLKLKIAGFTLLEMLLGIVILSSTILGPFTLASFSLRSASLYKNQAIAFHLAQEAIEYLRNRRDSNSLAGNNWLRGFRPCQSANGCIVDVPNPLGGNNIVGCPATCPKIKFDSASGFYNYDLGNDTVFIRKIVVDEIVNEDDYIVNEAKITVTVSWQERFFPKSFTIQENIFNWR